MSAAFNRHPHVGAWAGERSNVDFRAVRPIRLIRHPVTVRRKLPKTFVELCLEHGEWLTVAFEWQRLATFVAIAGGLATAGELLLPTTGVTGFLTRAATLAAIPLALYAARFFRPGELRAARRLLARPAPGAAASG